MSRREQNTPDNRIDDLETALNHLKNSYGTKCWLHTSKGRKEAPYIERNFYGGHYDVWFQSDIHYVTEDIAQKLKNDYLVEGKKHWGWTDNHQCQITDHGYDVCRKLREERENVQKDSTDGNSDSDSAG